MTKNIYPRLAPILIVTILAALIAYFYLSDNLGFDEKFSFADPADSTEAGIGQLTYVRVLPRGKGLWDWLDLLIVPAVLAGVGVWFSWAQHQHELNLAEKQEKADQRAIESRAQEAALQLYLDRMTELLLERKLAHPEGNEEVREIARVRTLTILRRLDQTRVRFVLQFLHDLGLITDESPVVALAGAALRAAHLKGVELPQVCLSQASLNGSNLVGAVLSGARLQDAMLNKADLRGVDFQEANLEKAYLVNAILTGADLRNADLSAADCNGANLAGANLKGANLNGTKLQTAILDGAILAGASHNGETCWPDGFTPEAVLPR